MTSQCQACCFFEGGADSLLVLAFPSWRPIITASLFQIDSVVSDLLILERLDKHLPWVLSALGCYSWEKEAETIFPEDKKLLVYHGNETNLVEYLEDKGYYFAVNVNWTALLRICTGYPNPAKMKWDINNASFGLANSNAIQNEEHRKRDAKWYGSPCAVSSSGEHYRAFQ